MFRIQPFANVKRTEAIELDVWQLVEGKIVLKKNKLNLNHVSTYIRKLSERGNDPDALSMRAFDSQILEIIRDKKFNDKDARSFIATFICHSEAGLLSPLYYKRRLVYNGNTSQKTIQLEEPKPLEPFKNALPKDFLGEVFSKVEGLQTAMMMNMATKQGITKLPDYYRYVETLPVVVCKLAIEDYKKSISDKDRSTFMFVIRRAICSGEKVAKIIFHLFARRKLELPEEIVKLLMIERQFDPALLTQLWYIGRSDIIETLYKDGVISREKLDSLSKVPYAPDPKKLPIGYERLRSDQPGSFIFEKSIGNIASYTFLLTGDYGFVLSENPHLFLDAAEKGLVTKKYPIIEYSQTIAELSDDIKKRIYPFVEEDAMSNFLLRGIDIPDVQGGKKLLPSFIIKAGLDPRNYPEIFSTVSAGAGWFGGCMVLDIDHFKEKVGVEVKINEYFSYSMDTTSSILVFYEHHIWGDKVYTTFTHNTPHNVLVSLLTRENISTIKNASMPLIFSLLAKYDNIENQKVLGYMEDFATVLRSVVDASYKSDKFPPNEQFSTIVATNDILTEYGLLYLTASKE